MTLYGSESLKLSTHVCLDLVPGKYVLLRHRKWEMPIVTQTLRNYFDCRDKKVRRWSSIFSIFWKRFHQISKLIASKVTLLLVSRKGKRKTFYHSKKFILCKIIECLAFPLCCLLCCRPHLLLVVLMSINVNVRCLRTSKDVLEYYSVHVRKVFLTISFIWFYYKGLYEKININFRK